MTAFSKHPEMEQLHHSRIENIVFSPCQQDLLEVHTHSDKNLLKENFHDKGTIPNSTFHFYTTLEFNSSVANRQLTENKLSFLHLYIRSIGPEENKFDALSQSNQVKRTPQDHINELII